jgi:hypothetical protein
MADAVAAGELLAMLDNDRARLDRALAQLDERGMIRVLGGPLTVDARVLLDRQAMSR